MKHGNSNESQPESEDSSEIGKNILYTVVIRPEDHMIFGADHIAKIIKRNPNEIPSLVKSSGLIAWQDGPKGKWRALCFDLLEFNRREKERNSKHCQ